MDANLEVFLIALRDGWAALRVEEAAPEGKIPTGECASSRREADGGEREPFIQSMSWRFEHGVLVLTYFVIADRVRSPQPERVDLAELGRHARLPAEADSRLVRLEVLWHGLRHLASS